MKSALDCHRRVRPLRWVPLVLAWSLANVGAEATHDWQTGAGYRFAPLPAPPAGAPGFVPLAPQTTGILFSNTLPVRQMMVNNNLMNGSGVAAGDFDQDGRCDLYFCAIDGTNALYRNRGGWRFLDVTSAAGVGCAGLHSTGAVFADVNGDGRLDLLVATLGTGVHCFLNQGDGKFRDATVESGLASRTGSTSLALADVDGNGSLDLYVANYGAMSLFRSGGRAEMKNVNGKWVFTGPYAERLRFIDGRIEELGEPDTLYLNDGNGRFRAIPWSSEYFLDEDGKPMPPPLDFGLTAHFRDLNGDGFPDLYVCNDFKTPDRIWLNDGKAHFKALPRLAMRKQSFSSMGVDFADLDRDGQLDFFTTEMIPRHHERRMREVVTMAPNVPQPGRIEDRPETARNALFHSRGDGTYAEIANYAGVALSDWSWQPVFLDVDLDGYEDLLIGNGMWFDVQDRDTLARIRALGKQTPEQSRTNLTLYPSYLTPTAAYRNRGDLTFEDQAAAWGFALPRVAQGMALADLDEDGRLDLIINCLNDSPLLYRNRGVAPRVAVRLRGLPPNRQAVGARIRLRGGPVAEQIRDVLCGGRYLSGDDPLCVFAAGDPTHRLELEIAWRSGTRSVVQDVRPNCLYEVDETGATPTAPSAPTLPPPPPLFRDVSQLLNHRHHEEFFVDYARQPLLMRQFSQWGPGVAWFDLDSDGQEELLVGSGKGGRIEAFRWTAASRFEPLPAEAVPPLPDDVIALAGWTDAQGRPAVAAALANYEAEPASPTPVVLASWRADAGRLSISPAAGLAPWSASPGPLAVADIDGDGQLELFVGGRLLRAAYPRAVASKIYRQGKTGWVPDAVNNPLLEGVGLVSGAVWSDLDGDGFPDLVLASEWGPVRVFHNDRGQLREATQALGLAPFTGWWTSVTTGDFDGDGRLDIVAGNWGLNDAYQASPEHPLRLSYGDLNGIGMTDLIESYFAPELNAEVPRRSLNALGQAFPVLLERFPTHEAFGRATLDQVLAALPQKAEFLTATTLRTTVFLNRLTRFVVQPLPAEAQFAPAFSVNVGDADGDGREDLFLSQNFFAVRPEWTRLDAGRGLWLRGDGQGGFTPLRGQESGIAVYGEQRGAALADYNGDGRLDLVVTQNGALTRVFENQGAKPGLSVRLRGPVGNPCGLGARLRLRCGEQWGPAREVHGGAGYGSQDASTQVLALRQPPTELEVLWPGGKTTRSALPPTARKVSVDLAGQVQEW